VISADRLISKLSAQDLMEYIAEHRLDELLDSQETLSNLSEHLNNVSTKFPNSERTQKQNEIAQQLADLRDIAVLAGPAGCGKTKIALEWAKLKNAKNILDLPTCTSLSGDFSRTHRKLFTRCKSGDLHGRI
jgi:CRISPR-associated endonuclease/helicase Cas3